ncbi:MAG: ATP-binding protein [Rhodothermaceae bacterium]|nr:ATP-binding protein [Rhodothermaceae bacterium]MXW33531.1 ATP-binding protein [Rhodothermaceae bacterium]MXX97664.1 ATP-binding protein [Rhodothermaceae bacterium]MXZ57981.1 ATP-binding protein [Rhodothermaceae bacterium]MYB90970.1 ATP-binding protein [Rhodothermaceae bacterium]
MTEPQHSTPDFISDRGPAEYFHGREKILKNFDALAETAVEEKGGSTFLIQGAPGVGKTALLDQCKKRAISHGWEVVRIGVGALWDSNNLLASLGLGEKYKGTERSTQIGFKNFFGWAFKSARPQPTVKDILKNGNKPLLLILDEAHALGHEKVPPDDYRSTAVEVLDAIHNGMLNRPVVLLAAGLGTTKASFGTLEISRYKGGCLVELGALSKGAERAVIRDWLTKEGRAKGDPTVWIDAIAQKTHGWPQHITAYADAAVNQIRNDHGAMTPEGLEVVYQLGMERREAYYRQRVDDFSGDEVIRLARLIADVGSGKPFNEGLVVEPLSEKYGLDEANKLFQKFLKKGVISADGFLYSVPVPSMHDWMKSELKRTQERLQSMKENHNSVPDGKTIGPAQDRPSSTVVPEDRNTNTQPAQSMEKGHGIQDRGVDSGWER